MVARVRPDSAGIPPAPAPPAGTNGQYALPGEQAPRPVFDTALSEEVVLSSLGRFAALLGQPYQRLKVAVLRELSGLPTPHWPLVRAEAVLDWLEPAEAARLLDELRVEELVVPASDGTWRLSEEAHLVAAVCAVLAVPGIPPGRLVRVLCAATSLALAADTEDEPAIAPFLAAVDVLDADFDRLLKLIEAGDVRALRSAARHARAHAADLAELLGREQDALGALRLTSSARAGLARAPGLARRVGALAHEVEATFATPARDLAPGGLALDKGALAELVAGTDVATLRGLVAANLPLPVALAAGPARCREALAALGSWLERPEPEPAPLPQPRRLDVEPIDVVPDFVVLAGEALTWLASLGDATLAKWVVGGTWSQAVTRMAAAVEAWSRWGPFGDSSLMATLEPHALLESVGHDEVAVTSLTDVRRRVAEDAEGAEDEEDAEGGPRDAGVGAGAGRDLPVTHVPAREEPAS